MTGLGVVRGGGGVVRGISPGVVRMDWDGFGEVWLGPIR